MSATILPFSRPLPDAVVAIRSQVPETAMTAGLLGTERHGHAVSVGRDGLLLTAGYTVMEADQVWLTTRKGQAAQAIVLALDHDSGLAVLRPLTPITTLSLETAGIDHLHEGAPLRILASGEPEPVPVELFGISEFAGRWEYLLERALYTIPLFERWSGAALLDANDHLVGIGSLAMGLRHPDASVEPGNMFIPVELVMDCLPHLRDHGQRPGQPRPWLGALVEEFEAEIHVVGLYPGAPAENAGLRPGDVIESVDSQPVSTMAGFFRTLWRHGPAGSAIPLSVRNRHGVRDVVLDSTDRNSFFMRHAANLIN